MCSLLQKIWSVRNLLWFQQKSKEPFRVEKEAFDLVIEFNKLKPKNGAKKRMVMQPNLDSALKSVHVLQVDASVYMRSLYILVVSSRIMLWKPFSQLVGRRQSQLLYKWPKFLLSGGVSHWKNI